MAKVKSISKKQIAGFVIAIAILFASQFIPEAPDLSASGRNSIAILLSVIALLVSEALPIGLTCILAPVLLQVFGCVPINQAFSGFTNHILFFVLASFGTSAAITKVNLSRRILIKLMKAFGKSVSLLLFAIMICTALISSVVSNVATTAVFLPIVMDFLKIYKDEGERKKAGKAFMIAIPIASMIGGMMTPAGSSLNLLCIAQLESISNVTITFTQWMIFGIPIVAFILPISWKIITFFNKIPKLEKSQIDEYIGSLKVSEKFSKDELIVTVAMIIMFVLWVLSSWISAIQVTSVAIFGFVFFMLPGINILTWKEFVDSVSWSAYFLLGSIMSLGNAVIATGASVWISSALVPSALNYSTFGVLLIANIIVFVLLIPVPVAPALVGILAAPFVQLANNMGFPPTLIIVSMGFCVANCYLLPLDTVPLITYSVGYYKMGELSRVAAPIQVILAVVVAAWIPISALIMGLN